MILKDPISFERKKNKK